VGGDNSHVVFWSKIAWWKRKCETVCYHDATASSSVASVQGEVFAHFHAVTVKHHSRTRNWLLDLPGQILCKQSPSCQRKWWACSWLCLFRSRWVWTFHVWIMLSSPIACQGLCLTFSEICTKFNVRSLSDPS
jgi:hypothetical protein